MAVETTAAELTAAELTTWDTTTIRARRSARVAAPLSQRREVVVSGDMRCIMIRSKASVNDLMNVGLEANVAARRSPPVDTRFPRVAQRFNPMPDSRTE